MEDVTLYELNNLVRSVVEQTLDNEYWLQAELSEARLATNGHFYVEFVQKDESGRNLLARARGTIWARTYNMIAPLFEWATGERLRAGMNVRVLVTIAFHELYGYSLNIVDIDPSYTLGDMAKRRREILGQLEADGIINDNKALSLPALLKRIAVISSQGAAGYGDFCDQLANNVYGLHYDVHLFPAVMQGVNVEESVLAALEAICAVAHPFDCVVIIRGGGATSDLSDFDTYALAAAVAQMPLPVIVGIGHERDETVLDFVAHTRVKTPTAAAAFLIEHGVTQLATLDNLQTHIMQSARSRIERCQMKVINLATHLVTTPRHRLLIENHRLDLMGHRFTLAAKLRLDSAQMKQQNIAPRIIRGARLIVERMKLKVENLDARLLTLDPARQLRRGYSLTYNADGHLVRSIHDLHAGETIQTRVADGSVAATVQVVKTSE